ncbi:MAG: hypothetical protein Q4E33_02480 [Erysipelotrichaceae bacterium]|nr:hypothetical protein [Erysipelotrichaceae bacterium]
MYDDLLYNNLIYFENNIIPNVFVLHTKNGAIVIKAIKENFMHLVGAQHSPIIQNALPASLFYNNVKNKKMSLYSIVDKNNLNNRELTYVENNIVNKNLFFVDIFESLIKCNANLYVYSRKTGYNNAFDCDYLHFVYKNYMGLYLGFVRDNKSDYHFFSSIIVEKDKPLKYLTNERIKITKKEIINIERFDINKLVLVSSKRNIHK